MLVPCPMKAPFHIEFQTEASGNEAVAIRDGYFLVEVDENDTRQLAQLARFITHEADEVRIGLEGEDMKGKFGAMDLQPTSGALLSYISCDEEPTQFKLLLRKWKKAFEMAGFVTGDVQIVERAEFLDVLSAQADHERDLIESVANGEAPEPRQEAFAFKM